MQRASPWLPFHSEFDPPSAQGMNLLFALDAWVQTAETFQSLKKELSTFPSLFTTGGPILKKTPLEKWLFYSHLFLQSPLLTDAAPFESLLNTLEQSAKLIDRKLPQDKIPSLFQLFESSLKSLFDLFLPFLEEAKSNENILLYLIEHRAFLNDLLGPGKIETVFQQLYPAGPAHLHAIVFEGYTQRGFGPFCSKHEAEIRSVDWRIDTDSWSPKKTKPFSSSKR
jgi:hypothetical protein